MEELIKLLTSSGASVYLILLLLGSWLIIGVLWKELQRCRAKIETDGPTMAAVIRDTAAQLDRLADTATERNRTQETMAAVLTANTVAIKDGFQEILREERLTRIGIDDVLRRQRPR
jgi:hypothetical protein